MFKNMKIRKSLIIGFGTTILVSVVIIIASLILMNTQKSAYTDILNSYVGANELVSECRVNYNIAARNLRDGVLSGNTSSLDTTQSKISDQADQHVSPGQQDRAERLHDSCGAVGEGGR